MFDQTLYKQTAQVLEKIKDIASVRDFYLAGGTALALQIGHRKSIDLDFFIKEFPNPIRLLSSLQDFHPTIVAQEKDTLDLIIETVKVSFFGYPYHTLENFVKYESTNMATIADIACMKLTAISSRGSKKDFIDLHFILQEIPLNELLTKFNVKYSDVSFSQLHILKSLVFFNDAENDPEPDMLENISWEEIKSNLERIVKPLL